MSYCLCVVKNRTSTRSVLSYDGHFMSSMLQLFATGDLLDDAARPLATEPRWPPRGLELDEERSEALLEHAQIGGTIKPKPSPAEAKAIAAYRNADWTWRRGRRGRGGRVPTYKFQSNDGWHVTAAEAKRLGDGVQAMLDSDDDFVLTCDVLDFDEDQSARFEKEVRAFVRFCRRAANADGFTVT